MTIPMEPKELTVSTLHGLIFLGNQEEKKLRSILANDPPFRVRMQAKFDLEKVLRRRVQQSEELARLRGTA
jgi:hypothetical protein